MSWPPKPSDRFYRYIAILPEAGVSRSFRVRECEAGAVRMAAEATVPVSQSLSGVPTG